MPAERNKASKKAVMNAVKQGNHGSRKPMPTTLSTSQSSVYTSNPIASSPRTLPWKNDTGKINSALECLDEDHLEDNLFGLDEESIDVISSSFESRVETLEMQFVF